MNETTMKYRIHKMKFQTDASRFAWCVTDENSEEDSGLFDSEGEAALYIYNLRLSEGG